MNLIIHTAVILIPALLFGWNGYWFGVGMNFGREVAQTEYRTFKLENRNWNTIKWIEPKHWKSLNGGWMHTVNNIVLPPVLAYLILKGKDYFLEVLI